VNKTASPIIIANITLSLSFPACINECMTEGVDVYYILKRTRGDWEVLWRGTKTSVLRALHGLCWDVIFKSSRMERKGERQVESVH
jgi:hypothetical protein